MKQDTVHVHVMFVSLWLF